MDPFGNGNAITIPMKRTRTVGTVWYLACAVIAWSLHASAAPLAPVVAEAPPTAAGGPIQPAGNLGQCVGVSGSQIPYPFSSYYSCASLGSAPGVPTSYGGLTFKYDDPNTLLIGGAAASSVGRIYQIGVTRDPNKHIIGFSGTAKLYPNSASKIGQSNDGGLAFGPENVLFVTRYPANQLEQTKPGSIAPNKVTDLTPLGIDSSVGSIAFLPSGFPGEGSMKLVSFTTGGWYHVNFASDDNGTFDLRSPTLEANVVGAEGIAFVPTGSPAFPLNSALIANYSSNSIITVPLDANGDPIMAQTQNFIQGVTGPEGAAIDPVTGDFLFCTFAGDGKIVRVSGFAGAGRPTGHCHFRVLIAYANATGRVPVEIRAAIQGDPDISAVELFDAFHGTPTLDQLLQYDIVFAFSDGPFSDNRILGDNLADYVDGGGVVVQAGDSYFGPGARAGITGRWLTGNYNPFDYSFNVSGNSFTSAISNLAHPLMAGITTLNGSILEQLAPASGATTVATTVPGGFPLVAYRPVTGGHATIGIAAFLGLNGPSGDWGRLVANAGRWLRPCAPTQNSTPTPTPMATPTPSATATAIPTATPTATVSPSTTPGATPTPAPGQCQYRVLIAYSDYRGTHQPTQMRDEIRADPDVAAIDLFDATVATPTLAKLQQYDIVMLSNNGGFYNPATLGDNVAAYVDGGGVVVECGFSFQVNALKGRWVTGNYNAFDDSTTGGGAGEYSAYIHDRGHPLMTGVTTLNFSALEGVTLPADATRLASALPNGGPLIAYRSIGNGHTTVGIAAFLGFEDGQTGDWAKLVVNAGRWLRPCGVTPTPTPTATPTATATSTPTPTATAIATVTPMATPTATTSPAPTTTPNPTASATSTPAATAVPSPTPTATPTPNSHLANISTRLRVEAGDNVLIAGFIIQGDTNKRILVRGIGPSLATFGIADPLQDPTMELNASDGTLIASNDNWPGNANASEILTSGLAPSNPNESALLISVAPGSYTAVLHGQAGSTGIGLVEVYDLEADGAARVVNISTRGFVLAGENVMIGGLIITGNASSQLVLRGIGPSLGDFGVPDVLADPLLELHDGNGALIQANNNWRDTQEIALQNTGLAPANNLESAIIVVIPPGNYTAVLKDADGATGNGLVEVYTLAP